MTENTKKESGGIGETFSVLIQALLIALVVRTVAFQPFSIPSASMTQTLLVGDYLFVSKFSYGYSRYSIPFAPDIFGGGRILASEPERGDVAVFRLPSDPKIDYIKRVVGLPGDRIRMEDGRLLINDQPVEREPAGEYEGVRVWKETLPNGVSYTTLDITDNSPADNTREFLVPEGHYFMMGDNRDNSNDSRMSVGFVPLENFVGRATIVFFSIGNGASPLELWRWPDSVRIDRLFKSAQE